MFVRHNVLQYRYIRTYVHMHLHERHNSVSLIEENVDKLVCMEKFLAKIQVYISILQNHFYVHM